MQIITKFITIFIVIYIVVGCIFATEWAITYNNNLNSFPNNTTSFIINMITWPSNF